MDARRTTTDDQRADRLALGGLRISLSMIFLALGWGLMNPPSFADGAARFGLGPAGRMFLGASHMAVGAALLMPNPVAAAASWFGALIVWATVPWLPDDVRTSPIAPCLLTFAFFVLVVAARLRRRRAEAIWRSLLARYAEGRGPG